MKTLISVAVLAGFIGSVAMAQADGGGAKTKKQAAAACKAQGLKPKTKKFKKCVSDQMKM